MPANFDINDAGDINDIPSEADTSVSPDAEVPDAGNDGGELDAGKLDVPDSGVDIPDAGTFDGSVPTSDGGSCIIDLDCPVGEVCLDGDGCVVFVGCADESNVAVCHFPQGTSDWNFHTICVGPASWPAHQAHGDYLGVCQR